MKKSLVLIFSLTAVLLPCGLFSAESNELAEIAILPFMNETRKKEYDWLSKSLAEALLSSMNEKFTFKLVPQDRLKAGLIKHGLSDGAISKKHIYEKKASSLCADIDADILIFGGYNSSAADDSLQVENSVYHKSKGKITATLLETTPITGKIFLMADRVAHKTVEHIKETALAEKKDKQQPAGPDNKIVLKKTGHEKKYLGLGLVYKYISIRDSHVLYKDEFFNDSLILFNYDLHSIGLTADLTFFDRLLDLRMSMSILGGEATNSPSDPGLELEMEGVKGFSGALTLGFAPFVWNSLRPWAGLGLQINYLKLKTSSKDQDLTGHTGFTLFHLCYMALLGVDWQVMENIMLFAEAGIFTYDGHGSMETTSESNITLDIRKKHIDFALSIGAMYLIHFN